MKERDLEIRVESKLGALEERTKERKGKLKGVDKEELGEEDKNFHLF